MEREGESARDQSQKRKNLNFDTCHATQQKYQINPANLVLLEFDYVFPEAFSVIVVWAEGRRGKGNQSH